MLVNDIVLFNFLADTLLCYLACKLISLITYLCSELIILLTD